jgi:hypothetical protein
MDICKSKATKQEQCIKITPTKEKKFTSKLVKTKISLK